jgi:hypothetical protein
LERKRKEEEATADSLGGYTPKKIDSKRTKQNQNAKN